jgi:hypothetical protein
MFQYSVECGVQVPFAWNFWTNVSNWALDTDIESVEINGPFVVGARGVTNSKSSGRMQWRIVEAAIGKAIIEFPLSGAIGQFAWTFEQCPRGCRITQLCTLKGDEAEAYAKAVGPTLEAGIPAGMRRLCAAIEAAGRGCGIETGTSGGCSAVR